MKNIADFGAIPDGVALNTLSIQRCIDECAAEGGGTVFFPPGLWRSGALSLCSNLTLEIGPGATLLGSRTMADYPLIEARWEGKTQTTHMPLLYGKNLQQVRICGQGTINGDGSAWWEAFRNKTLAYPRPRLIGIEDSSAIYLEQVTLENSPAWTVNPVRCENVHISHLTIRNPDNSPNTDGINPDSCRNVFISDCLVSVGDDCITLKSGTELEHDDYHAPLSGVVITNCILERGHGGIVIGSEMSGGVHDVVVSNCIMRGTDRGIRIKTRRGRGGSVERICIQNIAMYDVGCPFTINMYYHCNGGRGVARVADKQPLPVLADTPQIRDIRIRSVFVKKARYAAGFFYGLPEMPIQGLSLSDIQVEMDPDWTEPGEVEMADDLPYMARAGFYLRNVKNLHLHDMEGLHIAGALLDSDDSVTYFKAPD